MEKKKIPCGNFQPKGKEIQVAINNAAQGQQAQAKHRSRPDEGLMNSLGVVDREEFLEKVTIDWSLESGTGILI